MPPSRVTAGDAKTPPAVGGAAPDFELPDSTGAPWRLSTRVASGPVILVFYRGYW